MNTVSGTFWRWAISGLEHAEPNVAVSQSTATFSRFLEGVLATTPPQSEGTLWADCLSDRLRQQPAPEPETSKLFKLERSGLTRYQLLRKLEGVVIGVEDGCFIAHLVENQTDFPPIEATFELTEIPQEERSFAVEGASLVWTIG